MCVDNIIGKLTVTARGATIPQKVFREVVKSFFNCLVLFLCIAGVE